MSPSTQAPAVVSDDATALQQSCVGSSGGMVSTLSDLRVWSRALGTGALLKPAVWREAKRPVPLRFPRQLQRPRPLAPGTGLRRVRRVHR